MQKQKLHLIRLKNIPIWEQLHIEEALLRCDKRNICLINQGACEAVVMGISGKVEKLINEDVVKRWQIPIVKRFTGGGCVFVDSETLFTTFIFNGDQVKVRSTPSAIHEYLFQIYENAMHPLSIKFMENDYVIEAKKFGGNAQYLSKNRWLHHSSLLWDFDDEKMKVLKYPPKTPKYRAKRGHDEFLCRLKDFIPSKELFVQNLIDYLDDQFDLVFADEEMISVCRNQNYRKSTKVLTK